MQVEQVVGRTVEKNGLADHWSVIVFENVSSGQGTTMCRVVVRWTPVGAGGGVA